MKYFFFFNQKHLTMEQRIFYSTELIRHGWVDPKSILTDGVIEALYTDMLTERS